MNASMQEKKHGGWEKNMTAEIGTSKRNRNAKVVIGVQQLLMEKYQRRCRGMIAVIKAYQHR